MGLPEIPVPSITGGNVCTEGATKMEDCNTCHCTSGIWACTKIFCNAKPLVGSGTGTRNSPDPAGTGTMNLMPTSGEACLSACNMAHNPWKEIGETLGKKVAWNCVDKCQDVTCNRKCQIVYPNRGEELTVATCRAERCKVEKTTDRPTNKNYGVKGGLRTYVTRKPSANYGIKSWRLNLFSFFLQRVANWISLTYSSWIINKMPCTILASLTKFFDTNKQIYNPLCLSVGLALCQWHLDLQLMESKRMNIVQTCL